MTWWGGEKGAARHNSLVTTNKPAKKEALFVPHKGQCYSDEAGSRPVSSDFITPCFSSPPLVFGLCAKGHYCLRICCQLGHATPALSNSTEYFHPALSHTLYFVGLDEEFLCKAGLGIFSWLILLDISMS